MVTVQAPPPLIYLSCHEALYGVCEDDHTTVEKASSISNIITTAIVVEEIT